MSEKDNGKDKTEHAKVVREQYEFYDVPERYEMIGGIRYDFLASPTLNHQQLVAGLYTSIYITCHPNGIVVFAPMDIHFDEDNIVQPDVIFISNENKQIIRGQKIHGAPDLLVEILSPSTGTKDKVRKKLLYEQFGVKEYWIVDPVYETIDQLVWKEGKYQLLATYGPGDTLASPLLSCISINLDMLFAPLIKEDV